MVCITLLYDWCLPNHSSMLSVSNRHQLAHRRSQDFLCRGDLFLVITLFYVVICLIYYQQLPISHLRGVHLTEFSPVFASFKQKCLEKFFSSPWGVHLHPLATPMSWHEWTQAFTMYCLLLTSHTQNASESVTGRLTSLHIQNVLEQNCKQNWLSHMHVFSFGVQTPLSPQ